MTKTTTPRSRSQQAATVGSAFMLGFVLGEVAGWGSEKLGLPELGGLLAIAALLLLFYFMGISVGLAGKEKNE